MTAFAEITLGAMTLPRAEKVKLARVLLDEVDDETSDTPEEIERAWEEVILRRAEAVKNGAAKSRSVDEFFAELDRRHPSLKPVHHEN